MDSHQIVTKSKNRDYYSALPSCFRRPIEVSSAVATAASAARPLPLPPPPQPPVATNPNLTTSLYNTNFGLFALTWSHNLIGKSLHIHFLLNNNGEVVVNYNTTPPPFYLHIKPLIFWKKKGSKKINNNIQIHYDLFKAKFGSSPEPISNYYIAIIINHKIALLIGDLPFSKTRTQNPNPNPNNPNPNPVLRREHVFGQNPYITKANFGGREREISIDCKIGENSRLYISIDNKRVLQIKHLKWKFRGNERIEVDGITIVISWDVYNSLFDYDEHGYALFIFKFENQSFDFHLNQMLSQQSCGSGFGFGFGFETKMMMKKKGVLRNSYSSSSSSSLCSSSSSCSSSVMDWASTEENELKDPSGFSLLVYAWKS